MVQMEVENLHYTITRSKEECLSLMLEDIEKYGDFVLSAVTGDFGEEITSKYQLAVLLTAPLPTRMERIEQRTFEKYKERVQEGGDLFYQHREFVDFVKNKSLQPIYKWQENLTCPLIQVDGTKNIYQNVMDISKCFYRIQKEVKYQEDENEKISKE